MDKLVPADVLKVLQALVLPLELKINSLLDAVRSLEAKLDERNAAQSTLKEGKLSASVGDKVVAGPRQQSTSLYSTAVTGSRTPTAPRPDPKPLGRVTRKQRALAATSASGQAKLPLSPQPQLCVPLPQQSGSQVVSSVGNAPNVFKDVDYTPPVDSDASITGALKNNALDSHQWRVVRGRQRKLPIKGAGEVDADLATVEKTRQIHLWSLRNDVTVEQVQSYMVKKCYKGEPYVVEKLQLKHKNYASFVITVPESLFEFFMTAENWPPNIEFNEWFRRRNTAKENGDINRSSSQTNIQVS